MELLIPGLILVALMVYASTRIKKAAARAFEQEQVESDEFSITKPEGFLHPRNHRNEFAFEAYSKEFGNDGAEELRRAAATIRVTKGETLDEIASTARSAISSIISEDRFELNGARTWVIRGETEQNGIATDTAYKLIEQGDTILELKIFVLQEQKEDYAGKIDEMLGSFSAKQPRNF